MSRRRPANTKPICINTPDSFPAISFVLGKPEQGAASFEEYPDVRVYGYIKKRRNTHVCDAIEFEWRDRSRGWLQSPAVERGMFSCYEPGKYEMEIAIDFFGDQSFSTTANKFILLDIYESRSPE